MWAQSTDWVFFREKKFSAIKLVYTTILVICYDNGEEQW